MERPPIIKCYSAGMSICSQIVRLCLTESNLEYKNVFLDIIGELEQYDKWYARINPMMLVPCIEYNGESILDSKNIIWEITKRHPTDISPKNDQEKAEMEEFINSFYDKFGSVVGFSYRNMMKMSIFFVIMAIN